VKWSLRRGGQVMGTFRVRVHVPKELVDFIQEHCEWTQKAALEWIHEHWHDLTEESYDGLVVAYGEPEITGENEIEQSVSDGHLLYEGPPILTST
jgi:glutamate synthase domain-containing protein 3